MAANDAPQAGAIDIPFTPGFPPGVGRAHTLRSSERLLLGAGLRAHRREVRLDA